LRKDLTDAEKLERQITAMQECIHFALSEFERSTNLTEERTKPKF